MDDDAIRVLVTRLARPHSSGGTSIERAAVMAEGVDADAVLAWIVDHGGKPDAPVKSTVRRGLHGSRLHSGGETSDEARVPSRFVLPAGALDPEET